MNYLSTDEDESEDEYGAKRRTKSQKKRRRVAVEHDEPAEVRFSTRKAAKVTNYNEDDDDFEMDSDDADAPPYVYEEEEAISGIDLVLDHRLKDGVGKTRDYTLPVCKTNKYGRSPETT